MYLLYQNYAIRRKDTLQQVGEASLPIILPHDMEYHKNPQSRVLEVAGLFKAKYPDFNNVELWIAYIGDIIPKPITLVES